MKQPISKSDPSPKGLNRSPIILLVTTSVVLAAAICCRCGTAEGAGGVSRPNVVLIVVDTLRADCLTASRNGKPLMPNTLALAQRSWWYTEAYTAETWTKPSMVSIFTSLYPDVHAVRYGPPYGLPTDKLTTQVDALPASLHTMASVLKKAGYTTVGVQTNPHLQARYGFAQGFDRYEYLGHAPGQRVTQIAMEELSEVQSPFFLYLHYLDPHAPYAAPDSYAKALGKPPPIAPWEQALLDDYYRGYYSDLVLWQLGLRETRRVRPFTAPGREHVRYLYDAEVLSVDDQVGRVLRTLGTMDRPTVVVLTSDHGEELWEHGSIGHGKTVYREVAHVPLIVSFPGRESKQVSAPVETIDILPTLVTCLGLPRSSLWQGRDIDPDRLEEADCSKPVFAQGWTLQPWTNLRWESVLNDGYRLVMNTKTGYVGLYYLPEDPFEARDLTPKEPQRVQTLEVLLDAYKASNLRHPGRQKSSHKVAADAATIEQLRALGYFH